MSKWHGGIGSRQRPMSVDKDEFNRRFDEIFTGRKAVATDKNREKYSLSGAKCMISLKL